HPSPPLLPPRRSSDLIADVLVASQVISYEPQRVGEEQVVPRGPITPASTTLLNRFENVPHWSFCRPDGSRCERHVGPLLSGEKLDRKSTRLNSSHLGI